MKLYYNIAILKSNLVIDRKSAQYSALIKIVYTVISYSFSITGTILLRHANIKEQLMPGSNDTIEEQDEIESLSTDSNMIDD